MFTRTKIALATALILSAGSAALANDNDNSETGGFVVPGSMDGVNPAHHPDIFGYGGAARSYGFTAWPEQEDRSLSGKKGHSR
jgi:hypothetical protein